MNVFAPVSSIMVTDLVTVHPETTLREVKALFDKHSFHHLPVVHFRKIVGIISRSDVDRFVGGWNRAGGEEAALENTRAEEIMTKGLGKLEPEDRINVALEIFSKNWFHALPVVKNGDELVGIVTTQDIICALLNEKPKEPHMVYEDL